MCNVTVCSVESSPAKPDSPVSKTGGSEISRITDESSETTVANPDDWRTPWYVIQRTLAILLIEKFSGKL
jgi:hypothetical protein